MEPVIFHSSSSNSGSGSSSFSQRPLEEGIAKIRLYWCMNKTEESPIADFHKDIINCYAWSKASHIQISSHVVGALISFSKQNIAEIETIQKWIKEVTVSLSLELFVKKFEGVLKGPIPKKERRIKKFISRTSLILQRKRAQHELIETETLKKYVCILVSNFGYDNRTTAEKINPLLEYLDKTQYAQCGTIVEVAVGLTERHTQEFVIALMSHENIKSHMFFSEAAENQKGQPTGQILQAVGVLLRSTSMQLNAFATDILYQLLLDKTMVPFLEKEVFGVLVASGDLLYERVISLLKRVIHDKDRKTPARLHYLMQLILKNKQLVNRFNNREKPLDEQMRTALESSIVQTYSWTEIQPTVSPIIKKLLFNPLFYHLEKFMQIADKTTQDKIIMLFLTLIQNQGAGEDLVEVSENCTVGFEKMRSVLEMCVARYDCPEIFKGAASNYLLQLFKRVSDLNHLENVPCQVKLTAVNMVIDTYLEVQLEHIGRLQEKEGLLSLKSEVDVIFSKLSSANLGNIVKQFKESFTHILFHALYSDEDFKKWFRNENPRLQNENAAAVDKILQSMESTRKSVMEQFGPTLEKNENGKYKRVHNNQIGALAVVDACIDTHNVFLKMGTGQGKSLIAEMAAIRLLSSKNPPQRVFIFTSYDHLAKRDWENMKFLSDAIRYKSIYISEFKTFDEVLQDIEGAHIIHVDSIKFQLFLSRNFAHFLDGTIPSATVAKLMNILFMQQNNAVILDEGDLMIIDDEKHSWIHHFERLFFPKASINMATSAGRAQFDGMIGNSLINGFNRAFSSSYDSWYRSMSASDRESSSGTDEASGKSSNYAQGFARRVSNGNYEFHSLLFSFSSYVRSFRQVVFLSGSINEDHMPMFNKFFTNGKENLFANIPLFVGSHNLSENLREVTNSQCTSTNEWYSAILQDLDVAMKRKQPILLFVAPDELDTMQAYLSQHLKPTKWTQIKDEKTVLELADNIGDAGNITLATTICGRGIDTKVDKDIEWSLHVLVTKLPDHANDRLLTQMIGRTARLGRKGTYSIIVKTNYGQFKQDAANRIKKSLVSQELQKQDRRLEINQLFYSNHSRSMSPENAKKWVMLLDMIYHGQIDISNDNIYRSVQQFLQVQADGHTDLKNYEANQQRKK